ncbi:thioredoxin domain-containing protein [Altibacter sp.]|uniref:thioredoxin domain-containing protein n=1 Tax=Altibacter sp. TaxID=2024823 RepID=UPI00259079D9|nr:thioredoxin domain-containing protein [Altibacter sp.]MCW9036857.1 thioredoxin domain-containing protein [Altibacter sp.]
MRTFLFFSFLILWSGITVLGQSFNKEIATEGTTPLLIGKINNEALSQNSYASWYVENFQNYHPNTVVVDSFKETLSQYTITAFMGTWCGDSKREVPHFYKILEAAQFPLDRLTVVAVHNEQDNYKQSPGGEEEGLNIHRVPTFIFYKDGKEVNRIVESPVASLEEDIAAIVQNGYVPKYRTVHLVHQLISEMASEDVEEKILELLPQLRETTGSPYELTTYSNVLFFAGKTWESTVVARINTKLYPAEASVYLGLANKLYFLSKFQEALEVYHQALLLDPENENLRSTIAHVTQKVQE